MDLNAMRKTIATLTDMQMDDLFEAAFSSSNSALVELLADERVQRNARGLDDAGLADYRRKQEDAENKHALRWIIAEQTARALAG